MRERPILFNDAMVQAVLDGRKTQTRRVIKPQPAGEFLDNPYLRHTFVGDRLLITEKGYEASDPSESSSQGWRCPYGKPGDVLWVRETWAPYRSVDEPCGVPEASCARYAADDSVYLCEGSPKMAPVRLDSYAIAPHAKMPGGPHRWRPSIHMPRWASRITLEVTDVRVERVRDTSEEDAKAEGVRAEKEEHVPLWSYRAGFEYLWDSINGARGFGWSANPWVWVVGFKVVNP